MRTFQVFGAYVDYVVIRANMLRTSVASGVVKKGCMKEFYGHENEINAYCHLLL
ncbi:hypothetical protein Bca101_010951 [Brassica carinata]